MYHEMDTGEDDCSAPAAGRPAPLLEVLPQEGMRRHTGVAFELVLDPVVPQLGRIYAALIQVQRVRGGEASGGGGWVPVQQQDAGEEEEEKEEEEEAAPNFLLTLLPAGRGRGGTGHA